MHSTITASVLITALIFGGVSGYSATASAQSDVVSPVPLNTMMISASFTSKSWETPQLVHSFPGQARQLAISPNGQILAGVMDQAGPNLIKLWVITTKAEIATLSGHSQGIDAIAFSPNGQTFASSSYDAYGKVLTIKLWDGRTGQEIRTISSTVAPKVVVDSNGIEQRGGGSAIAFSADSQTLASVAGGNTTLQLWDISTGRVRRTLNGGEGNALVFSADGQQLARISARKIQLWNLKTGQSLPTLQGQSPFIKAMYSPDSQSLMTWVGLEPDPEQKIQVWNLKTGKPTRTVGGFHWDAQMALSPDSHAFAVGSPSMSLQLYDMQTGGAVANLKEYLGWSSAIAFSPEGQLFAASVGYCEDGKCIKVWR